MQKIKLNNSLKYFKQAKNLIPLASQTFSKSYLIYNKNKFPIFCTKGKNQYLYDLDNNKFLDLVSALGSVSIGYGNSSFNKYVYNGIKNGINFSLNHVLETELAKILNKIIPSAQMVRFGKNGTDVNSAAIRLARHITKKDYIAVCGYHGWHDWYISTTTMNGGIPKYYKKFTKTFNFNDINSLKYLLKTRKFAAVILEPVSFRLPEKNFLNKIKSLCRKYNSLLIFDEICTGFRISAGGAQKKYKITPDLSTFGKGIANGFPLSVLAGKKKYMKRMNEIFFSGTFGGEISSLLAAKYTIKFLIKNQTIKKNYNKGLYLKKKINFLLKKYHLTDLLELSGDPTWLFLIVKTNKFILPNILKEYIKRELINNKIIFLGSFNLNHSHNENNLKYIIQCFDNILKKISQNKNNLKKFIKIKKTYQIFSIRKN